MSWLLNLLMLGKGPPPNLESFTALSTSALPGKPYTITAKVSADVQSASPWFFLRFIAQGEA